ncbi:4-(cytidine 5'-diphospho)-2-C-methyl-D-erythritol kinase [uncultured Phascolarctobacterium sp.]|uniref:4-(cytidine 5'-diphospho)-2-C-methyl-D-erythritol kinase n=1 Tax=uncultured Phascolarctobacterium sp. TaxID=512296 RepID=UPI0026042D31|nr:4-(cytidine 5'-diphospho)-2-C-methyl-D-erythritol kinase [uncultured Phascolarctobacterium sp.]
MEKIYETAHAKINLGLDVLGKRPDGYHEVRMVMQSIGLSDTVTIEEGEGLTVETDHGGLAGGPDNLAWKAAALLARSCGKTPNVHIRLNKKIFLAAGLAGGSSDAAAVLRGLNRLWRLNMTAADLEKLAAELGSDIPFCVTGGTALAEGRGERLTALPEVPKLLLVLAKPKLEVATGWVYGNFRQDKVGSRPDIDGIIKALEQGAAAELLASCGNVLESVTIPAHPVIAEIKQKMLAAGAKYALMSGSGPTVFAVAESKEITASILTALTELDLETAVTTTVQKERI